MRFDETANRSAVEVPTGEEFDLSLPETQTAGYRWTLKNSGEPTCRLLRESFQPASGKTGGSGTHTWRFRGGASGTCSLALEYGRNWESNAEPTRTFGMTVRVQP
jgi:predicted secreted protein